MRNGDCQLSPTGQPALRNPLASDSYLKHNLRAMEFQHNSSHSSTQDTHHTTEQTTEQKVRSCKTLFYQLKKNINF